MSDLRAPTPGDDVAGVSRETLERLRLYVELVGRWNSRVNLVAPIDIARIWDRHVWDSAQLAPLMPNPAGAAADLGSGAGLPGLVLSIITGVPFLLVEADRRKAAFLREAVRLTEATASVVCARIETLNCTVGLVTARAAAPLPRLLAWAYPISSSGAVCLFPKGRAADAEVAAAERDWTMTLRRIPSRTAPDSNILCVTDLAPR